MSGIKAKLKYLANSFEIIEKGDYVECAVSKKKIPESIEITHTSLFDNTVAGIKIKKKPFFSVQYHPESSPGPQDSRYLFKKFENLLRKNA